MAKKIAIWSGTFLVAVLASLTPSDSRVEAQSADVSRAIDHAADTYGLSRRFMWCLALRESTYRPWVTSAQGDGGLYQFKAGTFASHAPRFGFAGASRYDAWAAAHVAAGVISTQPVATTNRMWPPSRWCGSPWW